MNPGARLTMTKANLANFKSNKLVGNPIFAVMLSMHLLR